MTFNIDIEKDPGTADRSGEIARILGKSVRAVAPTRAKLIRKGMVYSPAHGDTSFTMLLFDKCLQQTIPHQPRACGADRTRTER